MNDPIADLESELSHVWTYSFKGVFAKAILMPSGLSFYEVNKEVVDEKHLGISDLEKEFWNKNL